MFSESLPSWFTNLWILVVASIYGIKGTLKFLETEEIKMANRFTTNKLHLKATKLAELKKL